MSLTFIHTADWQLGRPYASVEDPSKQIRLQQEQIDCLARIATLVKETKASFVLVAGDLLDSSSPTKATVSAACSAIGKMGVPVIAIPGNRDHGGPGGPWEQGFLLRECQELAKEVKTVVDDKAKYTDWSQRAELKVDLIILLAENGYPPVDRDEGYKKIFEQAENFKKYQATSNS